MIKSNYADTVIMNKFTDGVLGNSRQIHLIKTEQYADRVLAVIINRLYSLLGGTRCTIDKINDGNPINQSSCVQCNFGTV